MVSMCFGVISMGMGELTGHMGSLTPDGLRQGGSCWSLVGRQMRRAE